MSAAAAPVLDRIRRWLGRVGADPACDDDLVRRFAGGRDEDAFAALVDRHGPMVLGVARRVLGDHHAAEDVFQATFLTLARRAGALHRPGALAPWLHRTAHNFAASARRARGRRDRAEAAAPCRTPAEPLDDLTSRELLAVLDDELRRLPEAFRAPLVLCCLEGRSHDEAARVLGWSAGSVKGRLERGRQRLRDRLARRGLTFAVAAGVPLLVAPPAVAAPLRQAAVRAAIGGAVPPGVAELVAGVRPPLVAPGWKTILALAAVGLAGVGLAWHAFLREAPESAEVPALEVLAGDRAAPPDDLRADELPEWAIGRLGSSRLRIGNSDFVLTPDGRSIVAVSPEGIVRRFDANDGRLLERRQLADRADVDPDGQASVHLSDDGRTAAIADTGRRGRRITVWDVADGRVLCRRTPAAGVRLFGFAISPDGAWLAVDERTGGRKEKQTLRVYDVRTGRGKEVGDLEMNVYDIRFTADGRRVVASLTSGYPPYAWTFACFDVAAGKQIWKLPRHGQEFALSPDGRLLATATYSPKMGYQVIETDPESDKATDSFKEDRQAHPNVRLLFAPDNHTLVANAFEGVRTFDLRTGQGSTRFKPPQERGRGYGREMGGMSPDGRTFVTNLGYLQRWELATGKPFFAEPPDNGLGGPVQNLAFSRDGKTLLASSWSNETAWWDARTGTRLGCTRHRRFGRQFLATPGGFRAVAADAFNGWREPNKPVPHDVTVTDPVTGTVLHTVRWAEPGEVGPNSLCAYTLAADGSTVLVAHRPEGSRERKTFVTLYDAAGGRRLARSEIPENSNRPTTPFSPCGRWAVFGDKVYHAATGAELFTLAGEADERLEPDNWMPRRGEAWFSEDGRLVAGRLVKMVAGGGPLAVWELATGKVLARIPETDFVRQVAFAPDGRTVALADGRSVRIRDLLDAGRKADYPAPDVTSELTDRGWVTQTLAFSPDGRTLASGHRDGSVLLWKVPRLAEDGSPAVSEAERERLWADLASDSPVTARSAVERLARHPAAAVALLQTRFRPTPLPPDPAVDALVRDLDSDTFAAREEATRKLREKGAKAETALRRHLAGSASAEARRRVEELLSSLTPPLQRLPLAGETLRGVRAIEVLERAGTPEARKLLEAWTGPGRDERLTAEAVVAITRLGSVK